MHDLNWIMAMMWFTVCVFADKSGKLCGNCWITLSIYCFIYVFHINVFMGLWFLWDRFRVTGWSILVHAFTFLSNNWQCISSLHCIMLWLFDRERKENHLYRLLWRQRNLNHQTREVMRWDVKSFTRFCIDLLNFKFEVDPLLTVEILYPVPYLVHLLKW